MRTKKQTLDGVGHLHDSILALGQSEIKFELTKKKSKHFFTLCNRIYNFFLYENCNFIKAKIKTLHLESKHI